MSFKAPFISSDIICERADAFRKEYHTGTSPVPIQEIVEFQLDLEIRPIVGLKQEADIDALLLGDWRTLIVDNQQYMDERYVNRLRFSIAHELGHYVLHKDVFKTIPRDTVEGWIQFMCEIPEREYSYLEFHASEFAGRLLVPPDELKKQLDEAIDMANKEGIIRERLISDATLRYISNPISRHFQVSSSVIERRLCKEKFWPL